MRHVVAGCVTILAALAVSEADGQVLVAGRAGDTIALRLGYQERVFREEVALTIVTGRGVSATYAPGDPRIRAVVNVYPDPVARAFVDPDLRGAAVDRQRDRWETVLHFDLPLDVEAGVASVIVTRDGVALTDAPLTVEILPRAETLATPPPALRDVDDPLLALERAAHAVVSFTGSSVPHSIQLELRHQPGATPTRVVNAAADVKTAVWVDDGRMLRVLLTPTTADTLASLSDFGFYVTGSIVDLEVTSVVAYDVRGNRLPDVQARVR